jgi:hypothetical protein
MTLLQFDPTLQALIGGSVFALSVGMHHAVAISSYGEMLGRRGTGSSARDHLFALANASAIVVSSDPDYRQLAGELAEFGRNGTVRQVDVKIPVPSDIVTNGRDIRKVVYLSDEHVASKLVKVVTTLANNELAHEVLVLSSRGGAGARHRFSPTEQLAVVEWSSSAWRQLLNEGNVVIIAQVGDATSPLILEALSNGLPCILHNDADGRRFASDGGCITADCSSDLNLSAALDLVVRDNELRADLVARAISRSRPDWRDWYARIFGMFCSSITHTH